MFVDLMPWVAYAMFVTGFTLLFMVFAPGWWRRLQFARAYTARHRPGEGRPSPRDISAWLDEEVLRLRAQVKMEWEKALRDRRRADVAVA